MASRVVVWTERQLVNKTLVLQDQSFEFVTIFQFLLYVTGYVTFAEKAPFLPERVSVSSLQLLQLSKTNFFPNVFFS